MPGALRARSRIRDGRRSRWVVVGTGWLLALTVAGAAVSDAADAIAMGSDAADAIATGSAAAAIATGSAAADSAARHVPPLVVPARLGAFVPESVSGDAFGNVFALDRGSGRIVRFDPTGPVMAFGVADQGSDRSPILTQIYARRGPDLYAIDDGAGLLYRFDLSGRLRAKVSYAEGLRQARLDSGRTADFALGPTGDLYLLDRIGGRLLLFDRNGRFVTDLFAGLAGPGRPRTPAQLALSSEGELFVLDLAGCRVRRFSREGAPLGDWAGLGPAAAGVEPPGLITVTEDGRVVLASRNEGRIWVRDHSGRLLAEDRLSPPPRTPISDLEAAGDTLLLLASPGGGEVLRWRIDAADHAEISAPR